jgi:hypothetical protein
MVCPFMREIRAFRYFWPVMRNHGRIRDAIVGGIALTAALTGRTQADDVMILGDGYHSCGEFLRATDDERKARPCNPQPGAGYTGAYVSFESYAQGFLSGINWEKQKEGYKGNDILVGSSSKDYFIRAMEWIENYCRQHLLSYYLEALVNLRNALAAKER